MPPLLYQLFYNLINNSLKFSKRDVHPVISISSKKVKAMDLEWFPNKENSKEYFEIEVKDNGIGFDSSKSEKMFQIFTRLNSGYEGTGLGLALCKKIALRHNGDIYAEGKEGEGATFHVILPVN